MFKSKIRPINIPQYEHQRLAGILASLWGNASFDRPPVPFEAFVAGVALHDWAYGVIDNLPIMELDEADWLAMARENAELHFEDPVTEVVVKMHVKRLLNYHKTPERAALATQVETWIDERIAETPFSLANFQWVDRITRFCDDVAFDFGFEKPTGRTLNIHPEQGSDVETTITYELKLGGEIRIDPWPFPVPSYRGMILGYQREGYPERLDPVPIPFHLRPG